MLIDSLITIRVLLMKVTERTQNVLLIKPIHDDTKAEQIVLTIEILLLAKNNGEWTLYI